ncbi:MAG TPA: hypothetical protein VFC79_13680 [Tissierellaceae bacterium]|nr:hypothetical protein [Tissierellaceae bacterium]
MNDMKEDLIVMGSSAIIQTICGITQTNEVFQRIQIIVAIISGVMAGLYYGSKFLIKLVKWVKKAKNDGKITIEELDELDNIVDTIKPKEEIDNDND